MNAHRPRDGPRRRRLSPTGWFYLFIMVILPTVFVGSIMWFEIFGPPFELTLGK